MTLHWIKNKGFWIQVITDKKNQVDFTSLPPDFKKVTKIKSGFNFVTLSFAEKEGVARSSMGDRELAAGSSWEARSREQPGAARSSRELGAACSRKQPGAAGSTSKAKPESY